MCKSGFRTRNGAWEQEKLSCRQLSYLKGASEKGLDSDICDLSFFLGDPDVRVWLGSWMQIYYESPVHCQRETERNPRVCQACMWLQKSAQVLHALSGRYPVACKANKTSPCSSPSCPTCLTFDSVAQHPACFKYAWRHKFQFER